jgi:16S rRNA processing protein RimM
MTKVPSNLICLATIVGVHGIKGAVKIKTYTTDPLNLFSYGPLQDETGHLYHLSLQGQPKGTLVIARIKGITTRNQAEALRNINLYIQHDQLPKLEEEEFYHVDLIGLPVTDLEGNDLGMISSIHNFGAGDLLEILSKDGRSILISLTKEAVPIIDLKAKKVVINTNLMINGENL